ncbi:MAG: hypothetical protein WA208_14675 [Thermoanaerobaculia bacterium]
MTGLLFTILFFPLIGLAVSRIIGRVPLFLAGAGAWGAVLFVAASLRVPLIVAGAAAIFGAAVVLWRTRHPAVVERVKYPVLPTLLLGSIAGVLLTITAIVPLIDYDGRAFWLMKAKAIAHERQVDGPYFQNLTSATLRNEYPLLVPIDAATVMFVASDLDDRHVRWLYVLVAISFALEVRRRFAAWFSEAIGAWSAVLLVALPQIAIDVEGGAMSASCDLPLAAFVACAFFELVDGKSPGRLGFWIACAALTKQEGLPFSLVLIAAAVAVFGRRAWIAAAPLAVAITSLLMWRARIPSSDEEDLTALLMTLPGQLDRVPDAVRIFGVYFVEWRDWGPFWIAVGIAAIWLMWRREWRSVGLASAAIFPMMAMYVAVYSVTMWNTAELASVTAARLLTHFAGPAMFTIAAAVSRHE